MPTAIWRRIYHVPSEPWSQAACSRYSTVVGDHTGSAGVVGFFVYFRLRLLFSFVFFCFCVVFVVFFLIFCLHCFKIWRVKSTPMASSTVPLDGRRNLLSNRCWGKLIVTGICRQSNHHKNHTHVNVVESCSCLGSSTHWFWMPASSKPCHTTSTFSPLTTDEISS